MSQAAMVASFAPAALSNDALRSIALELSIFCATILLAVVLKASSSSPGCSSGFLNWLSFAKPPPSAKSACQHFAAKAPPSPADPRAGLRSAAPLGEQAGGRRSGAGPAAQDAGGAVDAIMERACGKNPAEALSLYAELRSSGRHCDIGELARLSRRHSALDLYGALVQCAVRAGQPQLVESLMDDMAGAGVERTLAFYESAMKLLAGKKHYQQALAVYDRLAAEGLRASPTTLSCLINFTAELGHLDRALGFFEQLSATSTPSIRACMTALRVHSKRQDWSKSLDIFRGMQAGSVPVDSLVLNTVLATGVSAGKFEAAEALCLEVAKTNASIVDVISYNTVLKGFAHQKAAEKALKFLDRMLQQGVRPNGITFNTVMDAAVRCSQIEDAWTVLGRMQEARIQPDKYTCTILMKALHEDSTPKQLSQVLDMLQSVVPQCDPALRSSLFRSIFQVAARLGNTALLMRAFNQMLNHHVLPTTGDYQTVLLTLAEQGCAAHCSTVWRRVLSLARTGGDGQQPSTEAAAAIFTAAVDDLAKRELVEGMTCAFEALRTVVTTDWPEQKCDSAGPGRNGSEFLQQCLAALLKAASRHQHSSPALRRFLELAPEHGLSLEALAECR